MNTSATKPLLTVREAAELSGLSKYAIRRAIRLQQIPVLCVGAKWFIPHGAFLKTLQEGSGGFRLNGHEIPKEEAR